MQTILKKYVLKTTDLFKPLLGTKAGTCIVCGFETSSGHDVDLSDNFTAWNLLQEGEVICEHCYPILKNQDYRRKSWVVDSQGVRFLQRSEIIDTILNPPEPPFAIYITKTGKKQGYLHLINRLNYSKDRFFIAFDDSLIFVERNLIEDMVKVAKKARELKFSKSELLGDIKVKHWEHRELCEKILLFTKNPVWEVVVYAVE